MEDNDSREEAISRAIASLVVTARRVPSRKSKVPAVGIRNIVARLNEDPGEKEGIAEGCAPSRRNGREGGGVERARSERAADGIVDAGIYRSAYLRTLEPITVRRMWNPRQFAGRARPWWFCVRINLTERSR